MSLAKRGLGRGLEALLVEMPVMAESAPFVPAVTQDSSHNTLVTISGNEPLLQGRAETLQQARRTLLQEAEDLKRFLDDFTSLV
jgi:hypothetical protein